MTAAERWPHLSTTLAALRGDAAFGHASRPVGVDALRSAADTLSEMAAHIDAQDAQVRELEAERDRLARVLAVERGDETQAPEGWRCDGPGRWVCMKRGPIFREDIVRCPRPDGRAVIGSGPWWKAYHDKLLRWPTALDAMEALEVSDG